MVVGRQRPSGQGRRRALPMFPLGSVLFPSMPLVLHVFEPRYRALARRCVDGDRRLGVVLIERGSEVGGGDQRCRVGTLARIVEAVEFDDGRWGLGLRGERRIRVERWLADDPYPRADVVDLDLDGESTGRRTGDEAVQAMKQLVRRVLAQRAELGDPAPPTTVGMDPDPVTATWQAAILGGIGPADAQKVLESADSGRTALVTSLLAEQADVLAYRVAGG